METEERQSSTQLRLTTPPHTHTHTHTDIQTHTHHSVLLAADAEFSLLGLFPIARNALCRLVLKYAIIILSRAARSALDASLGVRKRGLHSRHSKQQAPFSHLAHVSPVARLLARPARRRPDQSPSLPQTELIDIFFHPTGGLSRQWSLEMVRRGAAGEVA